MPDGALLVFHPGALGDLVATFSNLLRLKKRWAGGIDGVCQDHLGKLACALGIFRRSFAVEAAKFASLYAEASNTSDPSVGPSIDPSIDPSMAAFFRPYRAVVLFSNSRTLERGVASLFRNPVYRIPPRPPVSCRIHVLDHVFRHLAAAGLLEAVDGDHPFPDGYPPGKRRHPLGSRAKRILIHPGSGSLRKNWPPANFTALARRLRREGMMPEFIVGPAEHHLMKKIKAPQEAWTVHTPATLGALRTLLDGGDGYVGNDAGVSHLAAFLGLPTLALFGPSDPVRWRPRGRRVAVLTSSGHHCDPCFEQDEKNCDKTPCLASITVDDVAARIFELLSGR
jgi:hypothetical protein